MDPPSYSEASLHPPALGPIATIHTPGPTDHNDMTTPSTPPPTYGEAVTPGNPYPVLTPPTLQAGVTVHQSTHIGVGERVESAGTEVVVQSEHPGVFGDVPCVTRCPYCHQVVTTTVEYKPGIAAWSVCLLFTLLGLICGCCLIPFLARGFQDAHHSCPHCHAHLHIHTRK